MDRITCSGVMANRTRLGSTTLYYLAAWQANGCAYTDSYIQNNANLFAYLAKLTAVHPGEWLSRCYYMERLLGFAQAFSFGEKKKKTARQAPTKTQLPPASPAKF